MDGLKAVGELYDKVLNSKDLQDKMKDWMHSVRCDDKEAIWSNMISFTKEQGYDKIAVGDIRAFFIDRNREDMTDLEKEFIGGIELNSDLAILSTISFGYLCDVPLEYR